MPETTGEPRTRHHHGSHRQLLTQPEQQLRSGVPVCAIVVPTARSGPYLQHAIDLAANLGCVLVALCSKLASIDDAERRVRAAGVELVAIDTTQLPTGLLPAFATTNLLAGTMFERRQDTSLKRNLGLLLTRMAGWQRIVFLDDDITVPEPTDLGDAAALLDACAGVGLQIGGFPDNSVVCHAYRMAGGPQDTFVGGGALAVGPTSTDSFFPKIYNEDWFFLLDSARLRPTAVTGNAIQAAYDPFADDRRARAEEFGDTLAEGLFWLLDQGRRVQDAGIEFWQAFLRKRRQFLNEVIEMVAFSDIDSFEKARMIASLKAARGRNERIQPQLCMAYLSAWRIDRRRWRRHIDLWRGSYNERSVEKVLSELGLWECSRYVPADRHQLLPAS